MSYKQIKENKGFTIIEVLIVLAIAGLILLIVFLAVPALQRSARNTQRKNDVSAALGAMSEYADNNNGTLPNTVTLSAGTMDFTNSGLTTGAKATAKVGYYPNAISIAAFSTYTAVTSDTWAIYTGATCSGNTPVSGATNGYVAVYGVETSGGKFTQACVE